MLRQNHRLGICLLHNPSEFLPETMIIVLGMSEIRRNIQSPAIAGEGGTDPALCDL